MKECYAYWADKYNVSWNGRNYKTEDFDSSDLPNKYISAINNLLYAITQAIIRIMGYSPAIGFIHTGHMQSFIFDISDLFKEELTIPLAFKLSSELGYFDRRKMIEEYRKTLTEKKIISKITKYLEELFSDQISTIDMELNIWDSYEYGSKND